MSIADKLSQLNGIKTDIKNSIIAKGGLAGNDMTQYAAAISALPSGGDSPWVSSINNISSDDYTAPGCFKNLKIADFGDTDMSAITDMKYAFNGGYKLETIILPDNLTAITIMFGCFRNCSSITSITLPSSLSKVTNMQQCFLGCTSLTDVLLPNDMTAVTNMQMCFQNCNSLTSITLPSSLTAVTNMSCCFSNCPSLRNVIFPNNLTTLSNLYMCFRGNNKIESIVLPRSLENVTNIDGCFWDAGIDSLSIIDGLEVLPDINLNGWGMDSKTNLNTSSLNRIIAALPTTSNSYTCTLGTTNLSKLTAEEIAVATNKGWTLN